MQVLRAVSCYIPIPEPKARHHRRRFVTPEHLLPLGARHATGGEFRVATDIPDYVRQTLEEVPLAGFDLVSETDRPWDDWIQHQIRTKGPARGRMPHYVTFRRQH